VTKPRRAVRIANCSGFYGDRVDAARELLDGPHPIDVLTGDYLAELTMLILWKARQRDSTKGYAHTFLTQMEQVLGTCLDRGVRVVTNAGGLNPRGLADDLATLSSRLGLSPRVAVVEGDDVLSRIPSWLEAGEKLANLDTGEALVDAGITPLTANAYLGGFGIERALAEAADVVVCPRVTDASLVVGPAAWWHAWDRDELDALAGAVVAGHIIECGAQATGGNYSLLDELPDHRHPGFPIVELFADGSSVITKQPGTGGRVSIGTVTAQLLYEIAGPRYANPDVVARFDTISLGDEGHDRVRVHGVRGEAPPQQTKVAINYAAGYRNTMTMVLTGLDIEAKANHAEAMLWEILGGKEQFDSVDVRLVRRDRPDAPLNEQATAELRVTVKDADPHKVGRRFSSAVVELTLASYAGFFPTSPPTPETSFGVYWPTLVPASSVDHRVTLPDGRLVEIAPCRIDSEPLALSEHPRPTEASFSGPTERRPLGSICGARSGDKGGNANVGVWTWEEAAFAWLHSHLTVDRFRQLVPDSSGLEVRRFSLPKLQALNFVVVGLLGEGVASSTRPDPQAKGLGEYLRSRVVDLPKSLAAVAIPVEERAPPRDRLRR
jgi:Acyclic terpene utilisation family protein AtuA